jgi:hypothetical protein
MQDVIAIQLVQVGDRIRKDMGDIEGLAESIKEHGLLHPIVLTPDRKLVCGYRRLQAARILGCKDIPFREVSVANLLKAERDENEVRKDLLPSEKVAIGRLIEAEERPKARERQKTLSGRPKKAETCGNLPPVSRARTRDIAAKAVGMGGRSYERAKAVLEAAESDPEKYGDLPASMDETGNVYGTYQELKRRRGGNGRHPIHRKTRYFKAEKALASAINALDGIVIGLDSVTPEMISKIDRQKAAEFGSQIITFARKLSKLGRTLTNG